MKKIFLALIFTVFGAFFGMSAYADSPEFAQQEFKILRQQPIEDGIDRQNTSAAAMYFDNCLPAFESGQLIYPDTYGGCYKDGGNFVILVTTSDLSEYLFLQEEFPCIVFKQVKYSYNYLVKLRDEYMETYDCNTETVYGGGIDVYNNRAHIDVDEETLSHKTNDPDSPLVFELGSPWIIGIDTGEEDDDTFAGDLSVLDEKDVDPADGEEISETAGLSAKASQAAINIRGGQRLTVYKENGTSLVEYISAGIGCTTRSGKRGLVVNGHDMKIGYRVFLDKTKIGQVTFLQYTHGAAGDYSIITLADNVTADGTTYVSSGAVRYNHNVYHPKLGDVLFEYSEKYGYASFVVDDDDYKTTARPLGRAARL